MLFSLPVLLAATKPQTAPEKLKVHGIFRSHMIIQRDKPITIWREGHRKAIARHRR
jgi:hypothetical protein